jgi:hypothetical protein
MIYDTAVPKGKKCKIWRRRMLQKATGEHEEEKEVSRQQEASARL